jgi:hypothetical protein
VTTEAAAFCGTMSAAVGAAASCLGAQEHMLRMLLADLVRPYNKLAILSCLQ